ncbi:MAG: flagellar hook-associated protein FlgL [Bdellovibrionaceae bacterium]|jgi:flagellar hook-associated protein 3 FlgL|nr:flagellar hook-associated protein FlgL [Pseudobdellovibrionaceae bacterium]
MRVADNSIFNQVRDNLSHNRNDMAELQNKAATQKRVTKPSDDPVAAARVLASKTDLQGLNQYQKDLNYAQNFLNFSDQSLDELTQIVSRVKELALGQASDAGANTTTRRVVGTEVEQLFYQVVKIGNRKLGDRYIFGGFKTTEPPFSQNGEYKGDDGEMKINIDKGSFTTMNIPGSKVFLGEGLSRDGISHASQKQPKTVEELKALQAKIHNDEQQKLNKSKELNNYDNKGVELRGPASVNSNGIHASAAESSAQENGSKNIFDVFRILTVALNTNDKSSVQDSLDDIDQVLDQVILSRSQIGSRSMALANALNTLQKGEVDSEGVISQLEDANVYEVISDINKTEGALKATLATSGKLIQPSLMDFLR